MNQRCTKNKLNCFKIISFLIFIYTASVAQTNSGYSILVAGHAYGAHAGTNIGLHPPFLNKLKANADSSVMGVFLTGDIVNNSTTASWAQVETELSGLGINSYYVMGNHDNNSIGHAVFQTKHGGTHYFFSYQNELYIILNSTESDRSISPAQLDFLDNVLANTDLHWERAFIFWHEVIWNSNEKYRLVRSNSRSRYTQMVTVSNFWQEVYPRLTALPDKKFYLFAGDVGGNPDAIAASYDRWGNVTLLSSGMGEVPDENYMKVNVLPDTVTFKLIPLDDSVEMNPITWYNIPEKPQAIDRPANIISSEADLKYQVSPVWNVTGYRWNLSSGISGSSDSSAINLKFDENFRSGKISAVAINDGFGESESVELEIQADTSTFISNKKADQDFSVYQNSQSIQIVFNSELSGNAQFKIYDSLGRVIFADKFNLNSGLNANTIAKPSSFKGFSVLELLVGNKRMTQKIILQ